MKNIKVPNNNDGMPKAKNEKLEVWSLVSPWLAAKRFSMVLSKPPQISYRP